MPIPARLPFALKVAVVLVCLAVLSWLSLAPSDELPKVNIWDKVEHAVAYTILAGVGAALFPNRLLAVLAVCFGYGVLIEMAQGSMGFGRQCDWHDVLANTLGALTALAVAAALRRRRAA
jgi:VanZ family protein